MVHIPDKARQGLMVHLPHMGLLTMKRMISIHLGFPYLVMDALHYMDLHYSVGHHPRMAPVVLADPLLNVAPEHHPLHSEAFTWGIKQLHALCAVCFPDPLRIYEMASASAEI